MLFLRTSAIHQHLKDNKSLPQIQIRLIFCDTVDFHYSPYIRVFFPIGN
jgi:hypothetical protein